MTCPDTTTATTRVAAAVATTASPARNEAPAHQLVGHGAKRSKRDRERASSSSTYKSAPTCLLFPFPLRSFSAMATGAVLVILGEIASSGRSAAQRSKRKYLPSVTRGLLVAPLPSLLLLLLQLVAVLKNRNSSKSNNNSNKKLAPYGARTTKSRGFVPCRGILTNVAPSLAARCCSFS